MVKIYGYREFGYLQRMYANGDYLSTLEGIGQPEVITGTGRATCRICGKKIKKGEIAIRFAYDGEGNAWTAIEMQIHAHQKDCSVPLQ